MIDRQTAKAHLEWSRRQRRLVLAMARFEGLLYGGAYDREEVAPEYDLDAVAQEARDVLDAIDVVRKRRAHVAKVAKLRDTHGRTKPEAETALRLADRLEQRGPRA